MNNPHRSHNSFLRKARRKNNRVDQPRGQVEDNDTINNPLTRDHDQPDQNNLQDTKQAYR